MNAENTDKSADWRHIGERTRRQLEELDALLERMLALPPFDLPEQRISSPQSLTSPSLPTRLAENAAPASGQQATADPASKFSSGDAGDQAADTPTAESAKVALTPEAAPRKARPTPLSTEEKKRRQRLREVEERITELEGEIAALARKLENPPADLAKVQRLGSEYARCQDELEKLMEEWEQLHLEAVPE